MKRDSYRLVSSKFRGVSPTGRAFFVDRPVTKGRGEVSIPRTLIHSADDLKLSKLRVGEEFTFRLFDWKAEEIGFA